MASQQPENAQPLSKKPSSVSSDLDNGGKILVSDSGKNERANRRLDVPLFLQPILLQRAQGRDPLARLFGLNTDGVPWRRQSLYSIVPKICERAQVPPPERVFAIADRILRGVSFLVGFVVLAPRTRRAPGSLLAPETSCGVVATELLAFLEQPFLALPAARLGAELRRSVGGE